MYGMWFLQLCLSGEAAAEAGDQFHEKDRSCKQEEKVESERWTNVSEQI